MKDPFEDSAGHVRRATAAAILVALIVGVVALAVFEPDSRTPLILVVGIVVMIMLHEAGHYVTAKRTGMKATEFFVGFGPRLWSFRRGETEYGVKAIPAGGYVRIIGMSNMEDVDPDDEPRTFRRARTRDRLVVVLAGVAVNAVIALVLFTVVIAGQGRVADGLSTRVSAVVVDSAADEAGIRPGDHIVAIEGRPIDGWQEMRDTIEDRAGAPTAFTVMRRGERIDLTATLRNRRGQGYLGVAPSQAYRSVGLLEAVPEAFGLIGDVSIGTAEGFADLVSPDGVERYSRNFTEAPARPGTRADLERPRSIVGIVDVGSEIVGDDVWAILQLLGGISLILALFNVLPLLPFDGGHAAVVVYEHFASKIRRREVRADFRKLMPLTVLVLAVFLTFGLSAMFLDVRQAIGR